jgi:carboxymethylenebutenolidase
MIQTLPARLADAALPIALLLLATTGPAFAQHVHVQTVQVAQGAAASMRAPSSEVEARDVSFQGSGRELKGKLFTPPGNGPFPAIVEIHGINGQSRWDAEVAQRLVREGYVTLVVDLFGRTPRDYGDGLRLRDKFRPGVPEDLRGAVRFLKTQSNVDAARIGTLGWCMGGGYALLLAVAEPTLAAGVIYYGPLYPPPGPTREDLQKINAPLIAFFGQEDDSLPIPQVKMFANDMKEAGKRFDLYIYQNAGHGFAERQVRPATHGEAMAPDPAADSWAKTVAFLATHLKPSR